MARTYIPIGKGFKTVREMAEAFADRVEELSITNGHGPFKDSSPERVEAIKARLRAAGVTIAGEEPSA